MKNITDTALHYSAGFPLLPSDIILLYVCDCVCVYLYIYFNLYMYPCTPYEQLICTSLIGFQDGRSLTVTIPLGGRRMFVLSSAVVNRYCYCCCHYCHFLRPIQQGESGAIVWRNAVTRSVYVPAGGSVRCGQWKTPVR